MKLRLPLLLQAALLSAFSLVTLPQQAAANTASSSDLNKISLLSAYTNPDILYQGQSSRYKNLNAGDAGWTCADTENVQFLNNTGSPIYSYEPSVTFQNNGLVLFKNNNATGNGGSIFMDGDNNAPQVLEFISNKTLRFENNTATGNGGAIFHTGYFSNFIQIGALNFRGDGNNEVTFQENTAAIGGAIYTFRQTTFDGNDSVNITGNKSSLGVAALYVANTLSFTGNKSVNISGNKNQGSVSGALYSAKGLTISGNDQVSISSNENGGTGGGAIYIQKFLNISGNGAVEIKNNTSAKESGAIYLNELANPGTSKLSADRGNITFSGNISGTLGRMALIASYDCVNASDMEFRAAEGYAVEFFDAFRFMQSSGSYTPPNTFSLELNKEAGYTGTILLSGAQNGGTPLDFRVDGNVTLHQGLLKITDNARLAVNKTNSTGITGIFTAANQTAIEITNGASITAAHASFQGGNILTVGNGASLKTDSLDLSKGVSFNLSPFLDTKNSGLSVTTGEWTLGGDITLTDLDFDGGDTRWEKNQKFLLLDDISATRGKEDFYRILIEGQNSTIIQSGTAFSGQWTYKWENGKLYAVWSTDIREGAELWWDGEGAGSGNGNGVWNQTASNKVWNKDSSDGADWDFADMDVIHFWKGGVVQIEGDVSVQGQLKPYGVIDVRFNKDKGTLVWQGNGSIVGTGTSLEKWGTGTLIIQTENFYGGGTTLYGGTIRVETLTGLGRGLVTIQGGHLDLGDKGVANKITVTGKGSMEGLSEGIVTVTGEGSLSLLAGTSFTTGMNQHNILVTDKGAINIQGGSRGNSDIVLDGENTSLNFVAGNENTSLVDGAVMGNGTINVTGGKHHLQNSFSSAEYLFEGPVNISGGKLTVSSAISFGNVNMTGGTFISDNNSSFESLTVDYAAGDSGQNGHAYLKTTASFWNNMAPMEIGNIEIREKATLHIDGLVHNLNDTRVKAGGTLSIEQNSQFTSSKKVISDAGTGSVQEGRIYMGAESIWNANAGFDLTYLDARRGSLTIGANSSLANGGFFATEKEVYGTDGNGYLLPDFTPEQYLPVLTIGEGATLWTGSTTKYRNGNYETLTGFHNITLKIDPAATIGTFVTKGTGDGLVTHAKLVESMKLAFVPEPDDQRNYAYILKNGIVYNSENLTITSHESIYVETGAIATVGATSGALVNLGGDLLVNQINETGTVTISGGTTDLTAATSASAPIHSIGSFGPESARTTAAKIKLDELAAPALLKVDTAQAQIGEKTIIGKETRVEAQHLIISGADTLVDNRGGALSVAKELLIENAASYNVGEKDQFGWLNMKEGNVDLTQNSRKNLTLGSYSASIDETAADIRLDETRDNTIKAKELHVAAENKQTLINNGTSVKTDKLFVGQGSHLNVASGTVNVHESLAYGQGAIQKGTIHLTRDTAAKATPPNIEVSFAGNSSAGHIDSSAASATFTNLGFNKMDGYTNGGQDSWVFVLTDAMLDSQSASNALAQIAEQTGNSLDKITLDTSKLTRSYTGDLQLFSNNITLTAGNVNYGEASGAYNQKDAVKNFRYMNPLVPEVEDITVNSLWTMTSLMDSFSSAVMGQMDLSPYRQPLSRNIWAKGLYMNENVGNALPGYRKDSGGYAIGTDTRLGSKSLLGVSFGQMFGTEMTNRHLAEDEQNILMAALYGRHLLSVENDSSMALDFMLGYGWANNDATFFKNGTTSTGDWKSNVFNTRTKLTLYKKISDRVNINPYVGGEFIFAEHKAHSIEGQAGSFDTSRSRMHALRLPIGTTVEYKTTSSVTNYMGASYVPDVLRRNPSATVTNGSLTSSAKYSGFGRHALRAYTGGTWKINDQWLVNIHYELEAASQKFNQNANITTNYSF